MKIYKYLVPLILFLIVKIIIADDVQARSKFYYTIQGPSYANHELVKSSISSLNKKGYKAFYEMINVKGKGRFYRLYIGQYNTKEQASKIAGELQHNNLIERPRIRGFMMPTMTATTSNKSDVHRVKQASGLSEALQDSFPENVQINRFQQNEIQTEGVLPDNEDITGDNAASQKLQQSDLHSIFPRLEKKLLSFGPLFKSIINTFNKGEFEHTLNALEEILKQQSNDKVIRESVMRLIAECYYAMGIKGNPSSFLKAVEQYKIILQNYPDSVEENDVVYYHMAASYEGLKFYYEAAGALERIIVTYPETVFLPDAMFKLGELLRQVGKYSRAIERFITYLNKYPGGKYIKKSYVAIGDCYHRLKKDDIAGKWYDEAWKRWPDFHDVPRDMLLNMGEHFLERGKFSLAYNVFSLYVNLYSTDEFSRSALYKMGRASEGTGQIQLAVKIYSLCIGKYPTEKEADVCALAMANLGVTSPGIKPPHHIMGAMDYQEPLKTYDKLLAKYPSGEQTADILFFKGVALSKYGKVRNSFLTYIDLISKFPQGRYTKEGRENLKLQAMSLVNTNYEKDDYLAVSDVYFHCYATNLLPFDDYDIAFKIAHCLYKTELYEEAAEVYEILLKKYKEEKEKMALIILALAKIEITKGKYDDAEAKLTTLIKQSIKNNMLMSDIRITLADLYHGREQYDKAASIYAEIIENRTEQEGIDVAYRNYGRSLMARNMPRAALDNYLGALRNYERIPKRYRANILGDIYMGLGEAYCKEGKYGEGIIVYRKALTYVSEEESKKWLLSRIGKAYAALNDFPNAVKNFTPLKEDTTGEFWPKVADYFMNAHQYAATQSN